MSAVYHFWFTMFINLPWPNEVTSIMLTQCISGHLFDRDFATTFPVLKLQGADSPLHFVMIPLTAVFPNLAKMVGRGPEMVLVDVMNTLFS